MSKDQATRIGGTLVVWSARVYLALALAAVAWLGLRDGAIPLALFVDIDTWPVDVGAGVGAALLLLGGWQVAVVTLPSARTLEATIAQTLGPLSSVDIVTVALLSGFSEELFFRGAVQSQWGLVAATVLFGLLHIGPGRDYRLWTVFALAAGAALGGLALWRGNLLAPVVAHVSVNLVGLVRLKKVTAGVAEEVT